jgi:peptidoglycan/LPS O-acetylase OafA/YrhL
MVKQRFIVLDGLRGLAAISVVAYHAAFEVHLRGLLTIKAWVAVDFFFCLSGFVLAFAHDHEIRHDSLTVQRFLAIRFARFFPIIVLGSLLGLAANHVQPLPIAPGYTALVFVNSLLLLPVPALLLLPGSSFNPLFINGVYWTLCIELILNIAYAALGSKSRNGRLLLIWAASGLPFIFCAAWVQSTAITPDSILSSIGSLARGFTSFSVGVLVYRLWRYGVRFEDVGPALPIGLFAIPLVFPYSAPWFKVPLDLCFILFVFPFVVWVGASCTTRYERCFRVAGDASFPLYAIHLPLLALAKAPFVEATIAIKLAFVGVFTMGVFFIASVVAKYYEKPARKLMRSLLPAVERKI